jgi:hypothetical protein
LTFLDNLANPLFPMTVHVSRINLVNQQGGDLQRVSKSRFQVPFCDHKERVKYVASLQMRLAHFSLLTLPI